MTKEEKKVRIESLFQFHKDTVQKIIGDKDFYYYPKVPFMVGGQRVLGWFRSELEQPGRVLFTELVNNSFHTLDPKRTLYKLRYNPEFETEYGSEGDRFFIPVDEFEKVFEVVAQDVKSQSSKEIASPKPVEQKAPAPINPPIFYSSEDAPINTMTIRDYAAITWQKPVSQKAFLNEMINSLTQPK
jgi:hypothetical protein